MGCPPLECCHGLYQDVKGGRVGPEDFKDVSRCVGEDRVYSLPPAANPFLGLFFLSLKGGLPRLFFFLGRRSERVNSELRVDGSGYVIPCAMDSSYHTEGIDPFLICVLCDEDGFQDFFVQECRRAEFLRGVLLVF